MREKLIELLQKFPFKTVGDHADYLIANDVVPVVRCKDCKHWECWRSSGEGTGDCHLDEGYITLATQHYDFCSYGERKDNERKTD